jgi:excisionase family DNA binding protein
MNTPGPHKLAYRIDEACRASGLSRSTLYKLLQSGELTSIKVAGRRLIRAQDLTALLSIEESER